MLVSVVIAEQPLPYNLMCLIAETVSKMQPSLSNRYPQLQGLSVVEIAQLARQKALPKELQYIIATNAMGSLL